MKTESCFNTLRATALSLVLACTNTGWAQDSGVTNLLVNGNFEAGDTGFTTDYVLAPAESGDPGPGHYAVVSNPNAWNGFFATYGDHTSGEGLMLIVDSATTLGKNMWRQTVSVTTHSEYRLSFWAASPYPGVPATVQVFINGQKQGADLDLSAQTSLWQSFEVAWNSGVVTQAVLELRSALTTYVGNDVTLDDLIFQKLASTPPTTVLVDGSTPGYYNDALGTILDGTAPQFPLPYPTGGDPTLNPAAEPNLAAAAGVLGNWLAPTPVIGNPWRWETTIPSTWAINSETAIIYLVDGGAQGIANVRGDFDADNGLFVWVNGQYKFGAVESGLPSPAGQFEYTNVDLGNFSPGTNYIQILRQDNGIATGYQVRITAQPGATNPPATCPTDAIAWWKAEDNATDALGAHDGTTPFGIAYADGKVGRAFDFDGSLRRINVPDSPAFKLTNAMSFEAWVFPRQYQGFITFRGDNRGGLDTWTLDTYQPGYVNFQIDDATNGYASVRAPLQLNEWQHVAATWDRASGDLKIYVNGVLGAQTNTTIIPIADLDSEGAVGIGNHGGTFHQFPFNGLIDELAIYSRALSASQVAAIYNAGSAGKCAVAPAPTALAGPVTNSANGHAYYLLSASSWTAAEAKAVELGGHLVTVNNAAEQTWVYDTFATYGGANRQLWIGLNDAVQEGTFVWASGEPATYLNWSAGEPNNYGLGEDYGMIFAPLDSRGGYWNDADNIASIDSTGLQGTLIYGVVELPGATPPACDLPAGIASWWKLESNGVDSIGTNTAILSGSPAFSAGKVGQAMVFDGSDDYLRVPAAPSLNVGAGPGITVETWIKPATVISQQPLVEWNNGLGTIGAHFWISVASAGGGSGSLWANLMDLNGVAHQISSTTSLLNTNDYQHVATTYDKASGMAALFLNGNQVAQTNLGAFTADTRSDVFLGLRPSGTAAGTRYRGMMDEVSIYGRALSSNEITAIYNAGNAGKCTAEPPVIQPPAITSHPLNQTVPAGDTAQFSVTARGSEPLSYQWFQAGDPIAGATINVLALANVQPSKAGNYFVVVSNAYGSTTSSNALLTVQTFPPTIAGQPADASVYAGKTVVFSSSVTGTAPLRYQWAKNGTPIANATNNSYTVANVQLSDAGDYRLTVTNGYGSATSRSASLTVRPAPVCVEPPADIVAWWPGESNLWDVIGGFDGLAYYTPRFSTGMVGGALWFSPSWNFAAPIAPELDLGAGGGFTFESWVNPDVIGGTYGIFGWGGYAPGGAGSPTGVNLRIVGAGVLEAQLVRTNGTTVFLRTAANLFQARQWRHVALSCDTTTGLMSLLVNGAIVAQTNLGPTALRTSGVMRLGNGGGPAFYGLIDEPTLYKRALGQAEIQSIYLADEAGKCPPPPPPCLELPGIVAFWQGESNALDAVSGNHASVVPTNYPLNGSYQAGAIGTAFRFNNLNALSVPRSESLDVGRAEGMTIEGWIYPQSTIGPLVEWTDTNNFGVFLALGYVSPYALEANLIDSAGGFHPIRSGSSVVSPQFWQHVALTYDKASGQATLYVNGSTVASTNMGSFTPQTGTEMLVGYHPRYTGMFVSGGPPTVERRFAGAIDELAIYRRALSGAEIQSLVRRGSSRCMDLPPAIGRQPQDEFALEGASASFVVSAGGTAPLHYKWFRNGQPLSGADDPTLSIDPVQMASAGDYVLIVSNAFGAATSRVARLEVLPAGECLPVPPGAVAWWKGENNEWDALGVADATWGLGSQPAYTNGMVGHAFRFNGSTSSYLQIPASPDLDVGRGDGFAVEGWIRPESTSAGAVVDWNDARGIIGVGIMLNRTGLGALDVTLTDTNAIYSVDRVVTFSTPPNLIGSPTQPLPGWVHIAFTFERLAGVATVWINGHVAATRVIAPVRTYTSPQVPVPFTPATTGGLYLGYRPSGLYSGYRFRGAVDEMTVYNRTLMPKEIQSICLTGSNGKCAPPPPACLLPPTEIAGWWRGESNTLDSVYTNHAGILPLGYSTNLSYAPARIGTGFRFNGPNHFRVPAAPSLDVGTGPGLTVEAWIYPTQFRPQPIVEWNAGTGQAGVSLSYSFTGGTGTMEANLVDANGASHQLFTPYNTVSYNAWLHVAVAYDKASGIASLFYNGNLITQTNLGSFTPRTSGNVYFGYRPPGAYTGSGSLFNGTMDQVAIYGRALTAVEIRDRARSRVGLCMEAPVIVEHPADLRVNEGADVMLASAATGNALLRYQWLKDGAEVPGANTATLLLKGFTQADVGAYRLVVSNNFGAASSSNALVTLNYPPIANASATETLLISPNGSNAVAVLDASLSSDPDGDTLTYAWFRAGEASPFASGIVAIANLPLGTNQLTLSVNDGMASGSQNFVVEVITTSQAADRLTQLVQSGSAKAQPLAASLRAALAAIDRSQPAVAINQLEAFKNKVLAQLMPVDPELAALLLADAQAIIDALNGGMIAEVSLEITSIKPGNNGKPKLTIRGNGQRTHVVEMSTNLVDWTPVGVASQCGDCDFEFQDMQSTATGARFYRVVSPK